MKFKIHSGLHSIGANILEVHSSQGRVITDFGLPLEGQDTLNLDGSLSLTEARIAKGHIPDIKGLYDASYPLPTAILISHLHLDHMGALPYLPSDTPVYMHEDSWRLYQALARYQTGFRLDLDFRPVKSGEPLEFAGLKILFFATDHDLPGASAIFIAEGEHCLIHSGDLRLNGLRPQQVEKFCSFVSKMSGTHLFLEGSSYSWQEDPALPLSEYAAPVRQEEAALELDRCSDQVTENETCSTKADQNWSEDKDETDYGSAKFQYYAASEAAWAEQFRQILADYDKKLIVINPYIANVERLAVIAKIAREAGREFLLEPSAASVLHSFYPELEISLYLPLCPQDSFVEENFLHGRGGQTNPIDRLDAADFGVETPIKRYVGNTDVCAHPEKYILQNSFARLFRLEEIDPGLYLHADGMPLDDRHLCHSYYHLLRTHLHNLGWDFAALSTSGHASVNELKQIARATGAEHIYPWHCGRTEYMFASLKKAGLPVEPLEEGKVYEI